METDAQLKLAMAMSILRSRSKQSRDAAEDVEHWKRKAKERKKELTSIKNDIQGIKDGMLSEMLPQVASCKCQFLESSNNLSPGGQIRSEDTNKDAINDVLFRQFLRKVRLRERLKNHKDTSGGFISPFGHYSDDDERGSLASAANFLLEFVNIQSHAISKQLFSTYSHQSVDFIKDSLQGLLEREKDEMFAVELVNNLIAHLIKKICSTPKHDDLDIAVHNTKFHVQHIMRKMGAVPFIGQRMLLATSQMITSVADNVSCMDPFDPMFCQVHEAMFIMLQLVEHLVSDYACSWSLDPTFNDRLLEEWIKYFFQIKKLGVMLEPRSSLYITYIDRIMGELAKQLNKLASLKEHSKIFFDIWSSLFT